MIVNKSAPFAGTAGIKDEDIKKFSIDENNSEIFKILREKIYSDPIGAICREIMTNSRDAHIEVGIPEVPIEILIIEPNNVIFNNATESIVFKDYGSGISPDRMEIAITYTSTTKGSSNTQSGGFGLGMKTPFAYSDQFTIITRVDGTEWTYTAFIDESEVGCIALLEEKKTNQPNGTEIVIGFNNRYDIQTFTDKCIHYSNFWDVKPKWVGKEVSYNNIKKVGSFLKNRFTVYEGIWGNYFLIDGIPYPAKFKLNLADDHCLCMNVRIGEFPLQISREQLQYTEAVNETIEKDLESLKERCEEVVAVEIEKCKTYIEACELAYKKEVSKIFKAAYLICDNASLKWNNMNLRQQHTLNYHDLYLGGHEATEKVNRANSYNRPIVHIDKEYWYVDTSGISAVKNRQIIDANKDTDSFGCYLNLIKPHKNPFSPTTQEFKDREMGTQVEYNLLVQFLRINIYSSFKTEKKKKDPDTIRIRKSKSKSCKVRIANAMATYNARGNIGTWGESSAIDFEDGKLIESEDWGKFEPEDYYCISGSSIIAKQSSETIRAFVVAKVCNKSLMFIREKHKDLFIDNGFEMWNENDHARTVEEIAIRRFLHGNMKEIKQLTDYFNTKGGERLEEIYERAKDASEFENNWTLNGQFDEFIPPKIKDMMEAALEKIRAIKDAHPLIKIFIERRWSDGALSEKEKADFEKILS